MTPRYLSMAEVGGVLRHGPLRGHQIADALGLVGADRIDVAHVLERTAVRDRPADHPLGRAVNPHQETMATIQGASGAVFGPGGEASPYRYVLWRRWADGPTMAVIGCNPSTATAEADDPTIRRCIRFARDSEHGQLVMLNLFGYRATEVRDLGVVADPVGPDNHEQVVRGCLGAATVVCAWGDRRKLPIGHREWAPLFLGQLRARGVRRFHALALTRAGDPGHPLYLPASARPLPWDP